MKKNTKIIIAALAVVVVIALFVGVYAATRPETTQGAKIFTVEVVHSDGGTKRFTYHTDEEYLGPVLLAEGLITGQEDTFGLTILSVDGEEAIWSRDNAYWAIFVGEEYGTTGVDAIPVNDGDSFKLVYTFL